MHAPNPHSRSTVRAGESGPGGPPSRYDLVLAAIPLAFVGALAVGASGLVAYPRAMLFAGVCGAAVLADALFVNPPGAG